MVYTTSLIGLEQPCFLASEILINATKETMREYGVAPIGTGEEVEQKQTNKKSTGRRSCTDILLVLARILVNDILLSHTVHLEY